MGWPVSTDIVTTICAAGAAAYCEEILGPPKASPVCFFHLQSEKPHGPQKAAMSQMCSQHEGTGRGQLGRRACAGGYSQRYPLQAKGQGTTGTTAEKTVSYCQKQVSVISMEGFTLCLSSRTLMRLSWAEHWLPLTRYQQQTLSIISGSQPRRSLDITKYQLGDWIGLS